MTGEIWESKSGVALVFLGSIGLYILLDSKLRNNFIQHRVHGNLYFLPRIW